jgi:hypothetical protein
MTNFIIITDDGWTTTSPMPANETVVIVRLRDGTEQRAFYSQSIGDPGDWDFMPVNEHDEPTDETLAADVIGWRLA